MKRRIMKVSFTKIPARINIEGESTTSQRKIAASYKEHIQEKINNLTKDKAQKKDKAMKIRPGKNW